MRFFLVEHCGAVKLGRMVACMKAIGKTTKQTEKGKQLGPMATCMKAIGKTTNSTEKGKQRV
jgi:hypothetical protein